MTPGEFLAVLDDADARAPSGRNRVILELRSASVMGHRGKRLGHDGEGMAYGYTRRQCAAMRETVLAAAALDAETVGTAPTPDPTEHLTFEVDEWKRP